MNILIAEADKLIMKKKKMNRYLSITNHYFASTTLNILCRYLSLNRLRVICKTFESVLAIFAFPHLNHSISEKVNWRTSFQFWPVLISLGVQQDFDFCPVVSIDLFSCRTFQSMVRQSTARTEGASPVGVHLAIHSGA
jgi:hypothetical protein